MCHPPRQTCWGVVGVRVRGYIFANVKVANDGPMFDYNKQH